MILDVLILGVFVVEGGGCWLVFGMVSVATGLVAVVAPVRSFVESYLASNLAQPLVKPEPIVSSVNKHF